MEDNIKLVLYPMKYKVASVSLQNKTIRLNKNPLGMFDEGELCSILVHELIRNQALDTKSWERIL